MGTRSKATLRERRSVYGLVLILSSFVASGELLRTHARAEDLGESADALPGVGRVAAFQLQRPHLVVAGEAGYGYSSGVLADDDVHHRAVGAVAVGYNPLAWLFASLELRGRYDAHRKLPGNTRDDGWVGDPRLRVRLGNAVSDDLSLAGQLTAWLPGNNAPSVELAAISPTAELVLTWHPRASRFIATMSGGFRLDQSAKSVERPDELSLADRMSLGLSDASAIPLGVALGWSFGRVLAYADWTLDLGVGSDAVGASKSPMLAGAGVRWFASADRAWQVNLHGAWRLSSLPNIGVGEPLAPIEPTFQGLVGLTRRFGGEQKAREIVTPPAAPPEPKPEVVPDATLAGRAVNVEGEPIAGAAVQISWFVVDPKVPAERATEATSTPVTLNSESDGTFKREQLVPGRVELHITAKGYDELVVRDLDLSAGAVANRTFTLQHSLPAGQIRGVIRSFSGEALAAEVRVASQALDASAPAFSKTLIAEGGVFELDVAPGTYEVTFTADGHRDQTRSVRVEKDGVTVLNVDMRKERRKRR